MDIQHGLIRELVQHGRLQRGGQSSCLQLGEQPTGGRGVEPGAEKRQRFPWRVTGNDLMQVLAGDVLITVCRAMHQGRWSGLGVQWAGRQLVTELLGQGLQVGQRLWTGEAQGHLPALIKACVEPSQGMLKVVAFHRQAVAVAGMKTAQGMIRRQALQQRHLLLGLGILGPGDELRLQHFAFTLLIVEGQARVSQHVRQTRQPVCKNRHRQFKEELGGALTGAGVDLPTVALHVGHQPFAGWKTLGTEKQQVLKKMRQPRPGQWHVMAAGSHV